DVREEDVQGRRLAFKAAQARLAEAEAQLALLKAGAWGPDLVVAKSEADQAEAQLKLVETNVDRLLTRAPMDAVVLQNRVRLGQYAQCGPVSEPLMVLGGGKPVHVRADVDENDSWRLRPHTCATAYVPGHTTQKYP